MAATQATIEVFVTAINSLPRKVRRGLVERLLLDSGTREDLADIARWLERRKEPTGPYEKARRRLNGEAGS